MFTTILISVIRLSVLKHRFQVKKPEPATTPQIQPHHSWSRRQQGRFASLVLPDTEAQRNLDALEDCVEEELDAIKGVGWRPGIDTLAEMGRYVVHDTRIFPEATNRTVTLNSHANANVYSAWTEIVDNLGNTLSSRLPAGTQGHISGIVVEGSSLAGQLWMLEIAHGAERFVVARYRFVSGSVALLPAIFSAFIRGEHILAGETIYYRLMCATGGQNCTVHIRYHYH